MPANVADMVVRTCDPAAISADIVFSALDSPVAADAEPAFARAGKMVLTNAKNYRMEPDVPLVIAEVNPSHLQVIDAQRRNRGWSGAIVANGNCASIVAALPLAPIHERFGIAKIVLMTMQAVSGAGYPGVASLDILGNVIPFIRDEEPKIEVEIQKFLGRVGRRLDRERRVSPSARMRIGLPVEHGHTVCMSFGARDASRRRGGRARDRRLARRSPMRAGFRVRPTARSSSPTSLIIRSRGDRWILGGGMTVVVGRVRPDPVFDVKLVAMGHNVIRGAAGASVLNAELMARCGMLADP